MDKTNFRTQIDEIDRDLVALFVKRMNVAAEIAAFKRANGIPVLDVSRENAKLDAVAGMTPDALKSYTRDLYHAIFELSRSYQQSLIDEGECK